MELTKFTEKQLEIILDAVEDYAVLVDESLADECGEILDTIEIYLNTKNR
tara:strand:+ start:338 stop:487 length:150 start_codon:yes stop_codon:yes gene_type:complete